jgi:hypothetical protein
VKENERERERERGRELEKENRYKRWWSCRLFFHFVQNEFEVICLRLFWLSSRQNRSTSCDGEIYATFLCHSPVSISLRE